GELVLHQGVVNDVNVSAHGGLFGYAGRKPSLFPMGPCPSFADWLQPLRFWRLPRARLAAAPAFSGPRRGRRPWRAHTTSSTPRWLAASVATANWACARGYHHHPVRRCWITPAGVPAPPSCEKWWAGPRLRACI